MKIAYIIVRILMGLLLLMSSVVFLFNLVPVPELQGPIKTFNEGVSASGYLMHLIKIVELFCGIAFVSGFYVRLANLVFFPIAVNIFLVHMMIAPEGIPVGIFLLLANLFTIYYFRQDYKPLLKAK